jgi:hypothetical protein
VKSTTPLTLLLVASLLTNFALLGLHYTSRPADATGGATKSSTASTSSTGEKSAATPAADAAAAAGLPADAARDAALGRAFARFAEKMRAARAASAGDGQWWRNKTGTSALSREQMAQARRELSEAMIAAFGDDLGIGGVDNSRLTFLSPEKREKLRSILGDYDELMAKFGAQGGIQLASDKEKLKLLTSERARDIAALLTPEELADYEMRTSATANTVRNRYGDGIATEEDFKKIYALQKAYDDKFPAGSLNGRITPEVMKARSDAALQLQADLRAAIGDEAYAALKRASDNDLKQVSDLASRLNLPADTTDRVAATRDTYAAESQRIMADAAIPFPQRREQLQALAARAKADLSATLGAEAADAYAQRSPWVSMLQSGMGYSTTPTANSPGALSLGGGTGPSVFPVMPAGVGGGATRQVVNFASEQIVTDRPVALSPGGNLIIGGTPSTAGAQVYSITSTISNEGRSTTDAPGTATLTKVITTAPAPASTPAPASSEPAPKP